MIAACLTSFVLGACVTLLVVRWYFVGFLMWMKPELTPAQRKAIADAMWRTGVP